MRRRDVGRGRRLRPVERIHRAREDRKLIRGCPAYWDHPRLIRPPRTRTGIVPRPSVNVRNNNWMVDI